MDELARQLAQSGYGEEGFAARYDAHRPRPPGVLLEMLPALAGVDRPRLVVDLGSGTGLSTRPWAERAGQIVGVEPNDAMRAYARTATTAVNVVYPDGVSSYETRLPDASADVVTASQSLQWMEPEPAFAEIARILRPGGVFAAYQYESLQTPAWEPEAAFEDVIRRTRALRAERGLEAAARRWPIRRERFEEAGVFREVRC